MNYFHEAQCADKKMQFARVWHPTHGVIKELSFHEFEREVTLCSKNILAQTKSSLNLEEDNGILTIGLLDKGSLQFFIHMSALQMLGFVPVLLNWRQPVAVIIDCFKDSNCQALLVGDSFSETHLATALQCISSLTIQYSSSSLTIAPSSRTKKLSACALEASSTQQAVPNTRGGLVFFTTGSTSKPKPVLHTYSTLMWTAQNFLFPENTTSTMCMLPNFHVLMTIQNFLVPYIRGIGVCILHNYYKTDHTALNIIPITAELVVKALTELEPTTLDTVPFILEELASLPYDMVKPLASTIIRCGGAPLETIITTKLIRQYGLRIEAHYGQTEAPGMQLLTVPNAQPDEINIMLPPFLSAANVSVSLMEATDELIIHGSGCSSPGYLSSSHKDGMKLVLLPGKVSVDSDRGHHTGDVFRWQTTRAGISGLTFVRRLDDVLITSTGELVNPHTIEVIVADALGLTPNAVVVLGQNRSQPIALVESSIQHTVSSSFCDDRSTLQKVLTQVNERCPDYARLESIIVLDSSSCGDPHLPRTIKGMVIRAKAEAMLPEILASRVLLNEFDDGGDLLDDGYTMKAMLSLKTNLSSFFSYDMGTSSLGLRGVEQSDEARIRKQAIALLRDGKNSADLATSIEGMNSLTAVRLTQRWREHVRAQEQKKHFGLVDRFKQWLCPPYHTVSGRSLWTMFQVRFAIEWYTVTGYTDGMDCVFDFDLEKHDSTQRTLKHTVLTSHELPKTGKKIKVHLWYEELEENDTALRPCILVVNGDAFYGIELMALPLPYNLIKVGFVIAQAERRRTDEGGVFPNALHDVAAAIRTVKGHSDSFNIDTERIGIFGDSSGGWFAAMFGALTKFDKDLQLKSEVLGTLGEFPHLSIDVACVVAICSPFKFDKLDSDLNQSGPWLFPVRSDHVESHHSLFLGHSCAEQPDRIRKASPETYITAKTPPFFLTHGTCDPCVSHLQTREFAQSLREASTDPSIHEYIEIPRGGHGTYEFSQPDMQARILAFLRRWLVVPQR